MGLPRASANRKDAVGHLRRTNLGVSTKKQTRHQTRHQAHAVLGHVWTAGDWGLPRASANRKDAVGRQRPINLGVSTKQGIARNQAPNQAPPNQLSFTCSNGHGQTLPRSANSGSGQKVSLPFKYLRQMIICRGGRGGRGTNQ
jgi:hypothetical protein